MISHRGICHRLLWEQQAHPLGPGERVLQVASHAFDASIWETFRPLLAGACSVVVSEEEARDTRRLCQLMARQRVTEAAFVPSLLEALLEEPDFGECSRLRRVVCAGEVLRGSLQERLLSRLQVRLENFYGQTEVSIDALCYPCERGVVPRVVPIGRPIADMQAYLLDSRLAPVPVGVWGELYLAGPGLARGYQHQPERTAERFLPSPFGEGQRLFRTGDLARLREDGVIEFRGRTDHQVKIRGVRVELGEIEALLQQHPLVREAVVVSYHELPAAAPELERLLSDLP
jgi:amino acid adenylation domain-containing protein